MRPPERSGRGMALDWLAAGAALLGGTLLLRRPPQPAPAQVAADLPQSELDPTARFGRGQPGKPPSREARRLGFETDDADAAKVAWVLAILLATAVACAVILFFLLRLFHAQLEAGRPKLTALQSTPIKPPAPLLEAHPGIDLQREDSRETRIVDGYGWRDAAHTAAHVPVARAMTLIAGRKLDPAP